ncbi:hypothetical protein JVU11DRAFT_11545 [Chiua virens]|nr:hypothetical protein JVU11DRAFT_11545 [Chiua virens]
MTRQFRHLKQLKQAGRGHDPNGIEATKEGKCMVKCPACPHPGINLPEGWEMKAPVQGWLYALFVVIDANFRLKRKAVSSEELDPSPNHGWAYFVKEDTYKTYLTRHAKKPQERSTCVSHSAVNSADTKPSRGLAATGVGTINCAQHEMKLPNGVGDLQIGERYLNMDYIVFSAVSHFGLRMYNFSYDIACQWHKKLWNCMSDLPEHLQLNHTDKVACQTRFSFNFSRWVGRTDGEAPEHDWANSITWLQWAEHHQQELEELQAAINPSKLAQRLSDLASWNDDMTGTRMNPFKNQVTSMTLSEARLRLTEEESQELVDCADMSLHTDISPFILMSQGDRH